jgi:phosphatidylserine/phosphatidylglycerophosphate/cardiolipin synthase-like enzyme
VYEWIDPLSLYHRKVMVIDEKHIIIGSYNLGIKSANYDYECALVIEDSPEIAKDLMSHISTSPRIKERTIKAKSILPDVPSLVFRQIVSPIMG